MNCRIQVAQRKEAKVEATTKRPEQWLQQSQQQLSQQQGCRQQWRCVECGKTFPSSTRFHKHLKTHALDPQYRCSFPGCGKAYRRKTHLTRHLMLHREDKPHFCSVEGCGLSFATRQKLDKHKTVHTGMRCTACGMRFRKRKRLDLHWKRVHGRDVAPKASASALRTLLRADSVRGEGISASLEKEAAEGGLGPVSESDDRVKSDGERMPHVCDDCGKRFEHFRHLVAHKRTDHPKAHICEECGKAYRRKQDLQGHKLRVHEEAFVVCSHPGCEQSFSSRSNLLVHVRVVHKGQRAFECRQCGLTFAYKHVLNRHCLAVHPATSNVASSSPIDVVTPSIGPCSEATCETDAHDQPKPLTSRTATARVAAPAQPDRHASLDDADFYSVLCVPADATDMQLRRAYKVMSLRYHPDKQGGSTRVFQLLAEAYATLSDPIKRQEYDVKLAVCVKTRRSNEGVAEPSSKRRRTNQRCTTLPLERTRGCAGASTSARDGKNENVEARRRSVGTSSSRRRGPASTGLIACGVTATTSSFPSPSVTKHEVVM
eukprot:TRINITY_DN27820_c0_g1_i1.p1 TRINITY_DN27820_c0_g1~~TRINITY_DN27820_c0_g1_i1.p1  ORF type:complete len:544 (+),score=53.57 TRINITY_DN27820_c0_g1_i1:785-2416(+)